MPDAHILDRPMRDMGKRQRVTHHHTEFLAVVNAVETTPYTLACAWRKAHNKDPWDVLTAAEDQARRQYIVQGMAQARDTLLNTDGAVLGKAGHRRKFKFLHTMAANHEEWQRSMDALDDLDARLDFLINETD